MLTVARQTGPFRHVVRAALVLVTALTLLFTAHSVFGFQQGSSLYEHWVYDLALSAAALTCLARASLPAERVAWLLISGGMLTWIAGDLYWNTQLAALSSPPYPSVADAGWLAFYPFVAAGAVALLRSRLGRVPASSWLDGLMAAAAISALVAAVLFDPRVFDGRGDFGTVATNAAYPIGDMVILGFVVAGAGIQHWRPPRAFALVGLAILVTGISDAIYLVETARGTYQEGGLIDSGWPIAGMLLAFAAWQPGRLQERSRRRSDWSAQAMTGCFSLLALALLTYDTVAELNHVAQALVTLTVAAIVVRLGLAARERRLFDEARRDARTDELTGLANRRYFSSQVDLALESDERSGDVAILLIDLDRFKELNDTLGHHAGDELLCQFADRLREVLKPARVIARLGGDEFVVLLDGVNGSAGAIRAARTITDRLEAPFEIEGLHIPVGASIGVALAPPATTTRAELLRHADVAMYRAKENGAGIELYSAADDANVRERLELASELRTALDRDEIVAHYQPKADLETGRITGVEALARWEHPKRGTVMPDEFIELAEQRGLMRLLTLRILDLALGQQQAWLRDGIDLRVSINLSASNLLDTRLPDDLAELLSRHGTVPVGVQLEITENTIMVDPQRTLDVLARISELGVEFSLDDYGTGYSSLARLRRLPVRELKIDRSFVMAMSQSPDDATIVRSTIELARSLGLHVVAEGVETEADWQQLVGWGCDTAQGFYLSRPVPAAELSDLLRGRAHSRS